MAVARNDHQYFTQRELRSKWPELRSYFGNDLALTLLDAASRLERQCSNNECGAHRYCEESLEISETRLIALQSPKE